MGATRADRTAIRRTSLSRPVALALQNDVIRPDRTFFDYGCGRGGDLLRLHRLGISVSGWDPAFFPDEERTPARNGWQAPLTARRLTVRERRIYGEGPNPTHGPLALGRR